MALPLAYAPVLQTEAQVGLSTRLQQVAEVVAVAGITEEYVVGITHIRAVGLHKVVTLGLLFARLYFVNGAGLQSLTFLLLFSQIVKISLVARLRQGQPVHHVTRVVQLEERHQLVAYLVLHPCREREVQGLACHGLQLVGNVLQIIINKDRSLIDGQLLAYCQLSETTVVGNQSYQVLSTRLHGQHDRTMHQGNILRQVGQILDAVVHREVQLHHITLLPLPADGNIAGRTGDNINRLAVHFHAELTRLHPTRIAHLQRKLALTLSNGQLTRLCIGETSLLTEHDAAFLPVQLGRYEEVHKQVVALMGIDELTVLAMVLHTCTHAAPHGLVRSRIVAIVARTG